jgi:hypothetical protein
MNADKENPPSARNLWMTRDPGFVVRATQRRGIRLPIGLFYLRLSAFICG